MAFTWGSVVIFMLLGWLISGLQRFFVFLAFCWTLVILSQKGFVPLDPLYTRQELVPALMIIALVVSTSGGGGGAKKKGKK